jgi:AcrR family transcriptional regulator
MAKSSASEAVSLKARVLAGAVELIEREGLGALSMREVARRAGVSHQAPYRHFPDREAIMAAIAEEGFLELAQRIADARDDDDLEHWVAAATRAYVLFALDRPAHFRLMFRPELADMDRFPQRSAAAREAHARLRSLAGATLRSSAEASEIDVRATYLWSLSHGLATLMLDSAHGRSLGTGARARIDAVTRLGASLLTQPAPRARRARR